ncbi:hypothetical protein [Streptomyces sp. NPDC054834]
MSDRSIASILAATGVSADSLGGGFFRSGGTGIAGASRTVGASPIPLGQRPARHRWINTPVTANPLKQSRTRRIHLAS